MPFAFGLTANLRLPADWLSSWNAPFAARGTEWEANPSPEGGGGTMRSMVGGVADFELAAR